MSLTAGWSVCGAVGKADLWDVCETAGTTESREAARPVATVNLVSVSSGQPRDKWTFEIAA